MFDRDSVAHDTARVYQKLVGGRGNWNQHWSEIAEIFDPRHVDTFVQEGSVKNQGLENTREIYSSVPFKMAEMFRNFMLSTMFPAHTRWHVLAATDPSLMKRRDVREWLDQVDQILWSKRGLPMTGWNAAAQEHLRFSTLYGTAGTYAEPLIKNGIKAVRYQSWHLADIYPVENSQGRVDTVYRRVLLTARQVSQMWEKKYWPERVAKLIEQKDEDEKVEFCHLIIPRGDEWDPGNPGAKGKPIASYYVAIQDKILMPDPHTKDEDGGGYRTLPVMVSRFEKTTREVHGRSLGMASLPDARGINEAFRTFYRASQFAAEPPILAANDDIDSFNLRPFAINPGTMDPASGRPMVQAFQMTQPQFADRAIEHLMGSLRSIFFVDLMQLQQDGPQMTATEVFERQSSRATQLAPAMLNLMDEFAGPLIDRDFDILDAMGEIPPPPEALEGQMIKVTYESQLAQSQEQAAVAGFARAWELATAMANIKGDQAPLDHFNDDLIIPEVAQRSTMPERWIRSPREVIDIRENRAQQEQQQQLVAAAPGAAAMVKAGAAAEKAQRE